MRKRPREEATKRRSEESDEGNGVMVALRVNNTNAEQARVAALKLINGYRARAGLPPVCRAEVWGLSAEQRLDEIGKAKAEAERVTEAGLFGQVENRAQGTEHKPQSANEDVLE